MKQLGNYWKTLKKAFKAFIDDNAFKLSASLSYYTIFSLGPVLIIIMSLAGIFWGQEAVEGRIYDQIKGLIGNGPALQIQEIIQNINKSNFSTGGTVLGIVLLVLGATGIFTEIQDSINYIWSVKPKPKKGLIRLLINRLLSFSLVVGLGFVLLVSLVLNALLDLLFDRLQLFFGEGTVYLLYALNIVLVFSVICVLFAIIFKVLPDAHIRWKDAGKGAAFTTLLFLGGKSLIGLYLSRSNVGVTYGAATAVILILLWVYYTSLILYFGAEFTKIYALYYGGGIKPNSTAVFILKQEAKEIPDHQTPPPKPS